ncbi:MAG: response regulator [Bacteroidetes bacterium]|nr:response regulator [Bacteroidota bacterium]
MTAKVSTVMLIDDNEIDNFINHKMLEGCNFSDRIYVHSSSKSALEFLINIEKMGEAGKPLFPKVIFLDLNMPIMDGYQFINEFEKISNPFKDNTKVFVLTSSMNPNDFEKLKKYPRIEKYVNKPLTETLLNSIL